MTTPTKKQALAFEIDVKELSGNKTNDNSSPNMNSLKIKERLEARKMMIDNNTISTSVNEKLAKAEEKRRQNLMEKTSKIQRKILSYKENVDNQKNQKESMLTRMKVELDMDLATHAKRREENIKNRLMKV